jgi:hypothetical protein
MNRTIQFWRIVNADDSALAAAFPAATLLARLRTAKHEGKNLEAVSGDGTPLYLELHERRGATPFLVLYRPRRQNQGHMSDNGVTRPLPFLAGQHVVEPTYLLFLERNIIGFLFHNEGPRPRRFGDYLRVKFGSRLKLLPILRTDLDAALDELSLQSLAVAISPNQAAFLAAQRNDPFATALAAAGQLMVDGAVEVTFKVGRRGSATERQRRRVDLARWARVFVGLENQEAYTKAKVIGRDNRGVQVAIDLLEENFVHKAVVQADEFEPGATVIRDDTPLIRRSWLADRTMLETVTPALADAEEDPGLLGEFREHEREDDADAGEA